MDINNILWARSKFNYSYKKMSNMTINESQIERAHANAVNKGFWKVNQDFVTKMNLIREELGELTSALRAGRVKAEVLELFDTNQIEEFNEAYRQKAKGTAEEELADVVIRIYDFVGSQPEVKAVFTVADKDPSLDPQLEGEQQYISYLYHLVGQLADYTMEGELGITSPWTSDMKHPFVVMGVLLFRTVYFCNKLANLLDIDLNEAVELKMKYNEFRPYLHGKKF
jgi:NTP pyrophosphatase (non-canonical NTP hydrolase)